MVRVLDKKLSKVLEMRTDSSHMMETLSALSSFYGKDGNTLEARRSLRSDLEKRNLTIATEFVQKLEGIIQGLENVEKQAHDVQREYNQICNKIRNNEDATSEILMHTEVLQTQRDALLEKAAKVESFLQRFQLSVSQRGHLYEERIDSEDGNFFDALSTVQRIREECTLLLGTIHQSAGMELLEEMSAHQEVGYDRLYKWCQEEVKKIVADTPDISRALRTGIRMLRERQSYYKHCQELFISTRKSSMVRRFLIALTRGGPNGMPRPIELQSHDPVRYVGDMLAWVHQAVASEKELFIALFATSTKGSEGAGKTAPTPVNKSNESKVSFEETKDLDSNTVDITELTLLDEVFSGILKPLTVRIDQVLTPQIGLVLAYKLSNLFVFYTKTISDILGVASILTVTIKSLDSRSSNLFQELMNNQTEKLVSSPPQFAADLSPPHAVLEVISRLSEILIVYNNSMVPAEEREERFGPLLDSIYEPLKRMCEVASGDLEVTNRCIFLINTYHVMQQILIPYDFVSPWVTKLTAELDEIIDKLVEENHNAILSKCGVLPLLRLIEQSKDVPLSTVHGLEPDCLQIVIRSFTTSLFALLIPQFDKIVSPKFRNSAKSGVARAAAVTYESLYKTFSDPKNKYTNLEGIFLHSPDQVRTLLDVM